MVTFSKRGFTLLEIMIVVAIIGILISAFLPAYSAYIERGRDVTRVTDMDTLVKTMNLYYSEKEDFPTADAAGCVPAAVLVGYGDGDIVDPLATKYNGCSTVRRYGYAMSMTIPIATPDEYSLVAIMEQPYAGNYSGSLVGFTGTLTQDAYLTGTSAAWVAKGNGRYYIRIP